MNDPGSRGLSPSERAYWEDAITYALDELAGWNAAAKVSIPKATSALTRLLGAVELSTEDLATLNQDPRWQVFQRRLRRPDGTYPDDYDQHRIVDATRMKEWACATTEAGADALCLILNAYQSTMVRLTEAITRQRELLREAAIDRHSLRHHRTDFATCPDDRCTEARTEINRRWVEPVDV